MAVVFLLFFFLTAVKVHVSTGENKMRKNVRVVRASLLPTLHSVLVLTFFLFELNSLLIIRSTGSSLNSSLELRPPARILLRRLTFYPTPTREGARERDYFNRPSVDPKISFSSFEFRESNTPVDRINRGNPITWSIW